MAVVVVAGGIIAAVLLTGGDDDKKDNGAGTGSPQVTANASGFPSSQASGGGSSAGGDDDLSTGGGSSLPSSAPSTPAGGGQATGVYYTVDLVVSDYFDALDGHSYSDLLRLSCQGYTEQLTATDVSEVTSATDSGPAKVAGSTATGAGRVVLDDGSSGTVTITMTQQSDEKWCVSGETAMN